MCTFTCLDYLYVCDVACAAFCFVLFLIWFGNGFGLIGFGLEMVWFDWVWKWFGLVWKWFGLEMVWFDLEMVWFV